ncbi:hypothetical protein, partial [Pseudomonas juntendi]|uniref:hypothetical protein n=1 Tax=Pseudomonas juntendi TaxID=2666183 RepID=UPI00301BB6C9
MSGPVDSVRAWRTARGWNARVAGVAAQRPKAAMQTLAAIPPPSALPVARVTRAYRAALSRVRQPVRS